MAKVLNLRKKKKEASLNNSAKKILNAPSPVKQSAGQSAPPPQMTWTAPSFYFNPQKRYLALLVSALVLGGCSLLFFSGDKLTSIFLLLSSLVLILYSTKKPEISRVTLNHRGIAVGDNAFFYKDLKSFWIHYSPGDIKELSLESKRWYMPYVKVSIENNNPLTIRSLLINYLPEKEHENSLIDIVSRKIGL